MVKKVEISFLKTLGKVLLLLSFPDILFAVLKRQKEVLNPFSKRLFLCGITEPFSPELHKARFFMSARYELLCLRTGFQNYFFPWKVSSTILYSGQRLYGTLRFRDADEYGFLVTLVRKVAYNSTELLLKFGSSHQDLLFLCRIGQTQMYLSHMGTIVPHGHNP